MDYFGTAGMQWEVQMGLLKMRGVKAVVRLGLVGGGHHLQRAGNGLSAFGNARSAGGRRKKDPILAAAGSRMLVAVSWRSPWIKCRMVKVAAADAPRRAHPGMRRAGPCCAGLRRAGRADATPAVSCRVGAGCVTG